MAETVDAIALHKPHGAGEVIRPDGLCAMGRAGAFDGFRDLVQGLIPGNLAKFARPLGTDTLQGMGQTLRMMDPLAISRDLGADHARRVIVAGVAPHAADGVVVKDLDLKGAGGRTIVGAGRGPEFGLHGGNLLSAPPSDKEPIEAGQEKSRSRSPCRRRRAMLRITAG